MRPPGWRFFLSSAFPETRLFFCFMKFYSQIYFIFILMTMKRRSFLEFFEISTEIHSVSLFFLNERKIITSLLMIHLKCAVVRYSNLNSRSINKPYLRAVEYDISFFFDFLFIFIFTRLLQKTLWNNCHFLIQTFKTHFKM